MSITTEVHDRLRQHLSTVSPGQPFTLSSAHQVGDGVWQGDLGIEIVSRVPREYVEITNPTDADRQLVPEAGQGSHHRLRSLDGVRLFRPADWGQRSDDLRGPAVVFDRANAIVHEPGHAQPHGTVEIAAAMTVLCRYQQNLDQQERAQRALD